MTQALTEGNGVNDLYNICVIAESEAPSYIHSVRVLWAGVFLCVLPLVMGLPAKASVTSWHDPVAPVCGEPVFAHSNNELSDARMMRESLRHDIARHPGDFVVFPTDAGAQQFVAAHRDDVERETDPRIIARGVLGYWGRKTIVVLPWRLWSSFEIQKESR